MGVRGNFPSAPGAGPHSLTNLSLENFAVLISGCLMCTVRVFYLYQVHPEICKDLYFFVITRAPGFPGHHRQVHPGGSYPNHANGHPERDRKM